ncbi:MAG: alpha-2-macroglobulin family protein [Victivallaceae bacterium]
MPDHLGSLRLMAVAANADRVGSAEREIVLRDRIGANVAAPLFLAPGDRAEFVASLFNFELGTGDFRFSVTLPPMLQGSQTVFTGELAKGKPLTVKLPVAALAAGTGELKWELALGSEVKTGRVPLSVRPVGIRQTRSETVALTPGRSAAFAPDPADWEPGSASRLTIADGPAAKVGAALEWLQSYPYGCCEQTVAAAFPLLAADELVKGKVIAPELAEGYRQQLAAAYARLLAMRLGDGSFAMWPGGNEVWPDGTLFAAHFIVEAVNRKVIAPDNAVLVPLRNWLGRRADDASKENRMRRAYAVYVLAAAGDDAFVNPARNILLRGQCDYASLLAALALVRGGYALEGAPVLDEAVRERVWMEEPAFSFATPASQLGMTLYLLLDNNFRDEAVLHSMAVELARQLRSDGGSRGTTQANAWAVLGLGIYAGRYPAEPLAATLETGGVKCELACGETIRLTTQATLTNTGKSPLSVTRSISGIPRVIPREAGSIKLKKEYLDAAGKAVDTVNHGDLVFIRLTISSPVAAPNVVIADLLPAGLAIEDELLATRSALLPPELRGKYGALTPKLLEKRDDRLLIFGDLAPGTAGFTCRARAVTRGVFAVPPVEAGAMYLPDLNGVANPGGVFTVK